MEQELISKKDLLDSMGISYGQLYRWKRKQLIPEDWFIRKSTFTGQETFFPKDQILARIDKILNMKEDLSLDELAGKLSPLAYESNVTLLEAIQRNIVSKIVVEQYAGEEASEPVNASSRFEQLLYFTAAERLLTDGDMSLDEGKILLEMLRASFPKFEGRPCELYFTRKMGLSSFSLISSSAEVYGDAGVKVIARLSMAELADQLNGKLMGRSGS